MSISHSPSTRVSDVIVQTLIKNGVDHFFLLAGGNVMFLNDAIKNSRVRYTAFHHEQAAAMAAEAYSRVSGKLAACVVTSGPGVSNLVTGVAGAFLDSASVIYIGGQAKSSELVTEDMSFGVRQFGTFELPGTELLRPICKGVHLMKVGEDAAYVTNNLCRLSLSGRPGPVYLEVPLDLQSAIFSDTQVVSDSIEQPLVSSSNLAVFVQNYLDGLLQSKKPLVIAGFGVVASKNEQNFRNLIEALDIQVVSTQLAKQVLPYSSSNFVGHVGIRGDRAGNLAVYESDCILIIGSSLQQQTIGYDATQFAPNARIFILDFESSVSQKNLPIKFDHMIDCSIEDFLSHLLTRICDSTLRLNDQNWKINTLEKKERLAVIREPHDFEGDRLNLYSFVDQLSHFALESDIIITDAGLCFYVMGQAFRLKGSQKYLVSGGLGSMGYALPASIGASTNSESRVLAVTGDGSMQMNIQELATLTSTKNNVFIFVINNEGYASIRNSQKSFFGEPLVGSSASSGVRMPAWEQIAQAYGIPFSQMTNSDDLALVFKDLCHVNGPVLIEVFCHINQQIMPMIASTKTADGRMVSNPLHIMSPVFNHDVHLPQLN